MSSPKSVGGTSREGTRIVLREITATLQNSSPTQISRRKSGTDSSTPTKNVEHEVKVRFAREFADATYPSVPGSLSSASSFHSLSSTLSSKSTGGAYLESGEAQISPNNSYDNAVVPGLEELIVACADIRINSAEESVVQDSQDLSQDQTFASATDEPILTPPSPSQPSPPSPPSPPSTPSTPSLTTPPAPQSRPSPLSPSSTPATSPQTSQRPQTPQTPQAPFLPPSEPDRFESGKENADDSEPTAALNGTFDGKPCPPDSLNNDGNGRYEESKEANEEQRARPTADAVINGVTLFNGPVSPICNTNETRLVIDPNLAHGSRGSPRKSSETSDCRNEVVANESPDIAATTLKANSPIRADAHVSTSNELISVQSNVALDLQEDSEAFAAKLLDSTVVLDSDAETHAEKHGTVISSGRNSGTSSVGDIDVEIDIEIEPRSVTEKNDSASKSLDDTVILQDGDCLASNGECLSEDVHYVEFKPQRQSTTLTLTTDQLNFDQFTLAAQQVANDIYNSSFEQTESSERFVSCEVFQDPTSFDFLLARGNSRNTLRDLRAESLYAKFDPLVGNVSMLPQGNNQTINEDDDGKTENDEPVRHEPATPKRNPAIAAIDRLLFYSPLPSGAEAKSVETPEKNVPKTDVGVNIDVNMAKELEIVRATVLQLEEELEKQKREHAVELERQSNAFQEKLAKLQAQLAQEVKNKNQMTVVMDEYEKSISRLVSERERDRVTLEQEKAKLQEELQAANHHLNNTEAAFNDVHLKYERLKGVVSAYKSNETVLKESIQENVETIKALENRYDQLKSHAMAQLEKANLELDAIKKQHGAETVKLHAMVRKAELKSNSLAELVEQKTKENKELAQILDEVIARVGRQNAE